MEREDDFVLQNVQDRSLYGAHTGCIGCAALDIFFQFVRPFHDLGAELLEWTTVQLPVVDRLVTELEDLTLQLRMLGDEAAKCQTTVHIYGGDQNVCKNEDRNSPLFGPSSGLCRS